MVETSLRITEPGTRLYVVIRTANVASSHLTPDLFQKACSRLRREYGLAAIPTPGGDAVLLVATVRPVPSFTMEGDEWELTVTDANESPQHLTLNNALGRKCVPELIERALLATLERRTELWTLDSLRKWYEPNPFKQEAGIAAYRRYEIGAVLLDGIGVGVSADVGTAFFTERPLSHYFDPALASVERQHRVVEFLRLIDRQEGQKGTLDYFLHGHQKCYYVDAPEGITSSTTGTIKVKGKTFASLAQYLHEVAPRIAISDDEAVVRVSFPSIERPVPVPARFLRARVMNDQLPELLKPVDKIAPDERRRLLQQFWKSLEPRPLGGVAPGFRDGFWRPADDRVARLSMISLEFAQGRRLAPPSELSAATYKRNFKNRLTMLQEVGCFHVPPTVPRVIPCAYPETLDAKAASDFARELVQRITDLARVEFTVRPVEYRTVDDAIGQVRRLPEPGVAVFILNDEPAAYHQVAFQLDSWRVKRITMDVLLKHLDAFRHGAWDRRRGARSEEAGHAKWTSFLTMNALDIIQLLDVVPWRIDSVGPYEAQLIIDVGYDRRHVSLSLLIARAKELSPSFGIYTATQRKPDHKRESINPTLLSDHVLGLFDQIRRRRFDPLSSLLVMRDGLLVGEERKGVEDAMIRLRDQSFLASDARIETVDFHKTTQKPVRAWEVSVHEEVSNVLEGTAIKLAEDSVLVLTTGSATLTQGTADPILMVSNGSPAQSVDAAQSVFAGAQLNWSSPAVAQRLPLPFKRTDEELVARAAQEVRRLS